MKRDFQHTQAAEFTQITELGMRDEDSTVIRDNKRIRAGTKSTTTGLVLHDAYLIDDLEVERDGLLAEDSLAGLGSSHDLSGVLVGGGADHHCVHLGVVDQLFRQSGSTKDAEGTDR